MIFTPGQLVILVIFTEIMIYSALVVVTNTIRHCATARAYGKLVRGGYSVDMNGLENKITKEVNKDENN